MVSKLAGLIAAQKENQNGGSTGVGTGAVEQPKSRLSFGAKRDVGVESASQDASTVSEPKPGIGTGPRSPDVGTVLPAISAESANTARPKLAFAAKRQEPAPNGVHAAPDSDDIDRAVNVVGAGEGLIHVGDTTSDAVVGSVPSNQQPEAVAVTTPANADQVPSSGQEQPKSKLAFGKRETATPAAPVNNGGVAVVKPAGLTGGLAALGGVRSTPLDIAERSSHSALESASGSDGSFSLDDIANFEGTDDGPSALDIYNDMIPADMPDRELPEEMTEGMDSFVSLIRSVYDVLNDPEQFGSTIRNLMAELQENPEYDKLLVDADVNTMMRGLRQTMGLAQIKKASTKKGAAKKTPSAKTLELATSLDGMFSDDDFT